MMKPAQTSKRLFDATKLLIIDQNQVTHGQVAQLIDLIHPGDLVVVNRSGTLPSSFHGYLKRTRESVEVRLAAFRGNSTNNLSRWSAVIFGPGDWRTPTENRGGAPLVRSGDRIELSAGLDIEVLQVDNSSPRLVDIEFKVANVGSNADLVKELYSHGRPIQYSYLTEELNVWDQQTIFSGPPISVEPPSSAFPFSWSLTLKLMKKGVRFSGVIHGAGLSSTGDKLLDARLPLREYFEIDPHTYTRILETKAQSGRVIALGTSVARALESAFKNPQDPRLIGWTDLHLSADTKLSITDAIITGMHESGTSHAELMRAFCNTPILLAAETEAHQKGYRNHEFGDLTFLSRCS